MVLTGTVDNGQTFSTTFPVEYIAAPEEDPIEVPSNLVPEFVKDLESFVVLDLSAASYVDVVSSGSLGQIVDYEGDPFTVIFSGNSTQFITATIESDGTITF